jgi:hypothetical protein
MPRVTVGPKSGGGWGVTGEDRAFRTQAEAERAARRQLTTPGGRILGARRADASMSDASDALPGRSLPLAQSDHGKLPSR